MQRPGGEKELRAFSTDASFAPEVSVELTLAHSRTSIHCGYYYYYYHYYAEEDNLASGSSI